MNKPAKVSGLVCPAFVSDAKAEFDALVARHPGIEFVDAVVVDLCGTLRGKRLPMSEAHKLFESGLQLPHSIYLMDARGGSAVQRVRVVGPRSRGQSRCDSKGPASWVFNDSDPLN